MIRVVSGIIVYQHRILLTQRRANQDFAYLWESPGGKVNAGESDRDALARELDEECGLWVELAADHDKPLAHTEVETPKGMARVLFYRVTCYDHALRPREGQGIGWFGSAEFATLWIHSMLMPGNTAVYQLTAPLLDL